MALKDHLDELENRLYTFLQKLDEKADLLLSGFLAEAPSIIAEDDLYGQTYSRFRAAMRGQIGTLREKLEHVRETQLQAALHQYEHIYAFGSREYQLLYDWRERCFSRIYNWEENLYAKETQAIEAAEAKDYEPIFKQLISDYHREAGLVKCKQCGSQLPIDKIYYYSVYIPCTFCGTQNIFDPGANARQLEETARKLAEQRSKHLLNAHHAAQARERELYHQMHRLKLAGAAIGDLEAQRQEAIRQAPELLQQYYRAVFDEMNTLLPDLREHHERFLKSLQASYLQHHH